MATVTVLGLPRGRALIREDLKAIPDDGHRYELLDGVLIVSPAPQFKHQNAVMRLGVRLFSACPPAMNVLSAPFDVVLADDTVMQPDLLVAAREELPPLAELAGGTPTEHDLPTAPLLAVEVLSPSTRSIDLMVKRERPQRAGCAHYWAIAPDERRYEPGR